jgi:hypothetical protein
MNDLLKVTILQAEIMIIKRDFDLLRKVVTQLKPEFQMQLIPYTALFCFEAIEYLKKSGYRVEIDQTSKYTIKDVRQKAKFFDLSINKLLQSIVNVDKLQNDYFISLMLYPKLGCWNVHTNIGIFYDEMKNIVSNTHYAYYVFQDEKMISKPPTDMSGYEIQGEEIRAFAYDLGRIIGSLTSALCTVSDFIVADVNTDNIVIYSQDFNTNRCRIKGNEAYKVIRLFLLHVLSNIGFIMFILKKAIIRESGLLLRIEYATYHYALMRLEGIMTFCNNNSNKVDDPNLQEMLNSIDYSNRNGLRKSEFRNCMMHFGLYNGENPLIEKDKIDLSIPFCGLIESQFGMTYDEYKCKIEEQLYDVYGKIKGYMGFDFLLNADNK